MTGKELKEKRKNLGVSQEEMAKDLGISKNTIYNYENGKVIPKSKQSVLNNYFIKEKKEELFIEYGKGNKISVKELASLAAVNLEELKKHNVFYNTFIVEALKLIEKVQNEDGSIDPSKLNIKN